MKRWSIDLVWGFALAYVWLTEWELLLEVPGLVQGVVMLVQGFTLAVFWRWRTWRQE